MMDEDDCRVILSNMNEGGGCDDSCDRDAGVIFFDIHDGNSGGRGVAGGGGENVSGLVPMLEYEKDEGVVDLLVVDKNGDSMLVPCGGCGQGVTGAHCCPRRDAHMHLFYRDVIGEKGYGKKIRCLQYRG